MYNLKKQLFIYLLAALGLSCATRDLFFFRCSQSRSLFFFLRFILFIYLFIYLFYWLRWVFHCCVLAFSSCSERGLLFVAVRGLFIAVASLVVEHRLQAHKLQQLWHTGFSSCGSRAQERRLSSCGTRAQFLRGMWDPPGPGLDPMSPALAGGFLTTAPPGKPHTGSFLVTHRLFIAVCGLLSSCGMWTSLQLQRVGSRARGLCSCSMRALQLWHKGSVIVVCRLSCPTGCVILVPRRGIKLASPCIARRILNHWTTREVPHMYNFKK